MAVNIPVCQGSPDAKGSSCLSIHSSISSGFVRERMNKWRKNDERFPKT
jgi:hypothetical protein